MIPFTVLFNALVIFLVRRKRYLRKQKPCVLLACLATTDLLVGAVALPSFIAAHACRVSRGSYCVADTVALASMFVGCGASLLHLVIISGERYVAIKHALLYESLATTRRLIAAVANAWVISVVSTFCAFINIVLTNHTEVAKTIFFAITILQMLVSLAAICFCQVTVFKESQRHRRQILAHQVSGSADREILKRNKAARTTTMIVGVLLLCYAPATICLVVILTERIRVYAAFGAIYVSQVFIFANSLVNPIIYCMRTQEFKRAIRELLGGENLQGDAQEAGNPSRIARRRIGEARLPFSGRRQQIDPSDRAHGRISRSHSVDLSRELANERRNHRKKSV